MTGSLSASRDDAEELSNSTIKVSLAVCTQIEGPITSVYRWEGRVEQSTEFRLMFKLLDEQASNLKSHIFAQHPYDVPEWIVVPAS